MNFTTIYNEILNEEGGLANSQKNSLERYRSGEMLAFNYVGAKLIPGNFYVFEYNSPELLMLLQKDKILYHDLTPVILSLGENDKGLQRGLNMNVLPVQLRFKLFSMLYQILDKNIRYNLEQKSYEYWKIFPLTKELLKSFFLMKSNIAINNYKRENMKVIKIVDWKDAGNLFFLYTKRIMYSKNMNFNKLIQQI